MTQKLLPPETKDKIMRKWNPYLTKLSILLIAPTLELPRNLLTRSNLIHSSSDKRIHPHSLPDLSIPSSRKRNA